MTTTTHVLGPVYAFEASEPGALDGHGVDCSCGFVARTSLSAPFAAAEGARHIAYFAKLATKPTRKGR